MKVCTSCWMMTDGNKTKLEINLALDKPYYLVWTAPELWYVYTLTSVAFLWKAEQIKHFNNGAVWAVIYASCLVFLSQCQIFLYSFCIFGDWNKHYMGTDFIAKLLFPVISQSKAVYYSHHLDFWTVDALDSFFLFLYFCMPLSYVPLKHCITTMKNSK